MGYKESLELAGAVVHDYQEFGSYSGDWWAYVTYNGVTGWINDYFGSCSGCDAFEGEFGSDEFPHAHEDDPYFNPYWDMSKLKDDCVKCQEFKARVIEFGQSYLENIITQEEAEEKTSENLEWDIDAKGMLEFVKSKRVKQ
jgi:hypothetical protein